MQKIGTIHSGFKEKFGIPRQSGLIDNLSEITFEPGFDDENAFRGLETFSHIWLLWEFSENSGEWHPTVRPPKLGGNTRMGVFATRSPFHPNSIGLSCVELAGCTKRNGHMVLTVRGADLMDGTPILDIKPYLPYSDSFPNASRGWTGDARVQKKPVSISESCAVPKEIDGKMLEEIKSAISLDPRTGYHDEDGRSYGMLYGDYNVEFRANRRGETDEMLILTISKKSKNNA